MKIIRIANFSLNSNGHGGQRYSKFVCDAFGENRVSNFINEKNTSKINFKTIIYLFFVFYKTLRYYPEINKRNFVKCTYKIYLFINNCSFNQNFKKANLVLWESTDDSNWFIPMIVKDIFNKKVIALVHNIESLVPNQNSSINVKSKNRLSLEIRYLTKCDFQIVISREEEWFLGLNGGRTIYLPYEPNNETMEAFLKVSQIRQSKCSFQGYLWFGSIGNIPAYNGLMKLLEFNEKKNFPDLLYVTGFETERLIGKFEAKNVKILGTTDNEKLQELLSSVKAVIISQDLSSGKLTKIEELLIANVPIFCNYGSMRGYWQYDQIIHFKNFNELYDMMSNEHLPGKNNKDLFLEEISKLLKLS